MNKKEKYRRAKAEYLEEHPFCELCGTSSALSIHHKGKRLGDALWDKSKFMTLCLMNNHMDIKFPDSNHSHSGGCHGWVEGNKDISRENKWII